jgi:hypothetical protein
MVDQSRLGQAIELILDIYEMSDADWTSRSIGLASVGVSALIGEVQNKMQ